MFIKQHFFNYPRPSRGFFRLGRFALSGYDNISSEGVLLIEEKNGLYNFYLPTLKGSDFSFKDNILCVFSDIKEYIYQNGLLLVKKEDNNGEYFIIIEPNSFCWYLTEQNLPQRIFSAPKIPCTKNSEVKFLNFNFLHGIFVSVNGTNYYISNNGKLSAQKVEGSIESSKMFNAAIISNKTGMAFFEDGKIVSNFYSRISEFKYTDYSYISSSHYIGYWCYNSSGQIEALRIGKTRPLLDDFDYSYSVDFDNPLKSIKFVKRIVISSIEECIHLPKFAIDLWAIETVDGEKKYLLQGIGEKNFSEIVSS